MAPLDGAVALVKMEAVAVFVAQNLHFDVLGARHITLQKHARIAKGAARFVLRFTQQRVQIFRPMNHAHAAPAAARRRFDDERETDDLRGLHRLGAV